MKQKFFIPIILIILQICSIITIDISIEEWRDYPACRLGRLQSPIEINETYSNYSNDFSFVYQHYIPFHKILNENLAYAEVYQINEGDDGGYINFERKGVIKQYKLIRLEIHRGLHVIDKKIADYELHLIHEKNLDFKTNRNQYRRITDPNMFLTVVLRYRKAANCKENNKNICGSDNGLLKAILEGQKEEAIDLNDNKYRIFQDKRAYFYEGSSLYIPCDENVNYYIVKDFFYTDKDIDINYNEGDIKTMDIYDRPVYKNFMNYSDVLRGNYIYLKFYLLFALIITLF